MSSNAKADGNQFLNDCQAVEKSLDNRGALTGSEFVDFGYCYGLIQGVRSSMQLLNIGLQPEYRTCWPTEEINNGQAVRIVLKYLRSNPEILNLDATTLVFRTFSTSYPCTSK